MCVCVMNINVDMIVINSVMIMMSLAQWLPLSLTSYNLDVFFP